MKSENKASERGESHAKSHDTESVRQIEKVGGKGEGSIKFPVHDHPDHSQVHGDGGKGCKP
jgi:general stress protein YciG